MPEFTYDEEVAARYDLGVGGARPGEVEFYLELARGAEANGLRTLEVTCGTGRITIPMAQAGIRIVGLDNSPAMLARARANSAGIDNVEWVEGDMRAFDLGEQFGLITIPIGSFQLLLDVEDQMACLRCIHRHLAPGGRLAFEVENPNLVNISEWLTTKRGTMVRQADRDYVDPETGRQITAWTGVEYHPSGQWYVRTRLREAMDASGEVVWRQYGQPMTVRYFHRYEMEHLLSLCGFAVEAMYGDLSKGEYRATSPDMIWVARRN